VYEGVVIISEAAQRCSSKERTQVTFDRLATINGTEFVNLQKTLRKQPGIVRSPLLNIVGHDPVLSIPFLHRMSNNNIRFIQGFNYELDGAGYPKLWFVAGVILNIGLIDSFIFFLALRRKQAFIKIQRAIDKLNTTEDGLKSEEGGS